jgi:hypothetical protein
MSELEDIRTLVLAFSHSLWHSVCEGITPLWRIPGNTTQIWTGRATPEEAAREARPPRTQQAQRKTTILAPQLPTSRR